MTLCKINDCKNEIKTGGLCSHHYYKLRTYGDPNYHKKKKIKICKIKNCFEVVIAHELCWKHYQRLRRYGRISIKSEHNKFCLVEGCKNLYFAKNYCSNHYYSEYYKFKIKEKKNKSN